MRAKPSFLRGVPTSLASLRLPRRRLPSRERLVILLHHLPILRWHVRRPAEQRAISRITFHGPPKRELEPLELLDDRTLEPLKLFWIVVDPSGLQRAELRNHPVELRHIHAFARELPAQRFGIGAALAILARELPDLLGRQIPPTAYTSTLTPA